MSSTDYKSSKTIFRLELRLWVWKRKLEDFYRFKILPIWYHYPKCQNCHHSYYEHVSYYESPTRDGICVSSDTPKWDMCECEVWR